VENRQPPGPGAPEPPLRGSLTDAPLPQILHRIFLEQLKGTLTLTRSGEVRRLFFDKGELKTATSSRETKKIGSFLKRRGRISDEDLAWVAQSMGLVCKGPESCAMLDRLCEVRELVAAEFDALLRDGQGSAPDGNKGSGCKSCGRYRSSVGRPHKCAVSKPSC